MLNVFETKGAKGSNLFGADLRPKAVEINKKAHPEYNIQLTSGFDYKTDMQPHLVCHSGVLCQIPEEDYPK